MRKNIKKVMMTGVSGLMAAGLIAGSVEYASHMYTYNTAAAKEASVVKEIETYAKPDAGTDKVTKHETVYSTLDAYGNTTDVVVSEWLKNSGTSSELNDVSELEDITNTKGDEEFSQNGNKLVWNTAENDIYYQGKTAKKTPVSMEIAYKLDGEDVKVEDIVGKSGKLEINIKYKNTSKKKVKIDGKYEEIFTPFVMVTGMILPVDNFNNVTIDNGHIISEGDNNIVVAYGMPGLSESLDLDNLDLGKDVDIDLDKLNDKITDTVKITADVTDFEMKSTYTVATSELFNDLDLDDVTDSDKLDDKIDELKDAATDLVDGSDKISSNLTKLDNKFGDYSDAIDTLHDGIKEINSGSGTLKKGITTYTNGADELLEGVVSYVEGTSTLAKGAKEYTKNTKLLVDKVGELQTKGTSVLAAGSKQFGDSLNTYVATVNKILSADTLTTVVNGVSQINSGAKQLQGGVAQVSAGVGSLKEGVEGINAAAGNLTQYNSQVDGYMAELKKLYAEAEDENEKNSIMAIMNYVGTAQQVGTGIENATSSGSELMQGFSSVSGGLNQVSDGLSNIADSTGAQVAGGVSGSLADGLSQLQAAGNALVSGYETQLDAGINSLNENVSALYKAGQTLTDNNKTLENGADTLIKNTSKIKKNSLKLMANSDKLRDGIDTMSDGTDKLFNGAKKLVNKTGDVSDALDKLSDGAVELSDGMVEFRKKGVNKITNAVDDLLDSAGGIKDRFNAVLDASAEYKSFAGIDDDMDGSVKFIMSTSEVTADEE